MKKPRYEIEQNPETSVFMVLDNESQIVVHNEDGTTEQGRLVAGFKTRPEAEKWVNRMNLRHAWGV